MKVIKSSKGQRERTRDAVVAVVEACEFELGVLVSVVRLPDGRARVETAVHGTGPANVGASVAAQLRSAADELERRMTESAARVLHSRLVHERADERPPVGLGRLHRRQLVGEVRRVLVIGGSRFVERKEGA